MNETKNLINVGVSFMDYDCPVEKAVSLAFRGRTEAEKASLIFLIGSIARRNHVRFSEDVDDRGHTWTDATITLPKLDTIPKEMTDES